MSKPIPMRNVVLVLSGLWVVIIAASVAMRIGFPLELEWMEGGTLQRAHWIRQGYPVFPRPSAEFVPFLYTPLYSVVLAALGTVLPLGLVLGRLVSVVAWAAIGFAIWRAVHREGKPTAHAVASLGLMCAGYMFSFRWMDLARADTLFMALLVWGLVLLREAWGDHRRAAWAGLLLALAFWTKQTAFVFVLAGGIGALLVAPRQLPILAGVIALVDGGGVLIGNLVSDGALWTYIYELHQSHAFNHERFRVKTWGMFIHAAPFVAALLAAAGARLVAPWLSNRRRLDARGEESRAAWLQAHRGTLYWLLMTVAGLLASALGYSTQWAEPNAFIPAVVLGALLVGVALPVGGREESIWLGFVAAQLLFSLGLEPRYQAIQDQGAGALPRSYALQDPARTIPSSDARQRAAAVADELADAGDRVFALHRPWWSIVAGGEGHVGSMGIQDVDRSTRQQIQAEIRRRLGDTEYDVVWLEGEPPGWIRRELGVGYRLERRLVGADRVRPMTGYMSDAGMVTPYTRPQLMFRPVAARPPPAGGRIVLDFEGASIPPAIRSGRAFGSRPVRLLAGKYPAVGPHGGEFFLSSAAAAGRDQLVGTLTTAPIAVGIGESVSLWVGVSRKSAGLRVEVLAESQGEVLHTIDLDGPRFVLQPRGWTPDGATTVRLRLVDQDPEGSLFVDDVWVVPSS